MASAWASIGSFFGLRSSSSRPPFEHASSSYYQNQAGPSHMAHARESSPFDQGGRAPSFDEAALVANGGSSVSYPPHSYATPTLQQNGFENMLVSPGSQYPPSQSPFISPASGSRVRLNGQMDDNGGSSTLAPMTSYPALRHTFHRVAQILQPLYPELLDTLGNPVAPDALSALVEAFGRIYHLPRDVRESMACHDGQDIYSLATSGSFRERNQRGLVWGLWLMTSDEIGDDYRHWRTLERKEMRGEQPVDDPFAPAGKPLQVPGMASCPAGWIREEYSHPGWIPLLSDGLGNYIGIDLDPPSNLEADKAESSGAWQALAARPGQVIAFGREIDCKTVLFPGWGPDGGWARFLSSFADDLESGEFGTLGLVSHGDPEEPTSADGLGEIGYFDEGNDRLGQTSFAEGGRQDRFRDTPPSGGSWRLKGEYAEMSVIEALCLRSRQRWAEVGLHASNRKPERIRKQSFTGADLPRSESQGTVRPASPQLMHVDPAKPPLAAIAAEPVSPEVVPASPRLTVSPPTPLPASIKQQQQQSRAPTGDGRTRRAPPPPPAQLDLPTLSEVDAFSTEHLPPPVSTSSSPRSSSDRRRSPLPELLPMTNRSPSLDVPQRKQSFGLSSLDIGQDRSIEVVVQSPEKVETQAVSPQMKNEKFGEVHG